MEYHKIANLLDTAFDEVPRFVMKIWIEAHNQSDSADDRYQPNKQIRFKTSLQRSNLCDYFDAYIVVKGDIALTKTNGRGIIDIRNKFLAFKNNAPFTNCVSNINNVLINNAEDLDIVKPMYNLLEYSKNDRKATGSVWNYYRDEPNNAPLNDYDTPTIDYNADSITNSESFKYKSSITGITSNANQENCENTEQENTKIKKIHEIVVPLKYLSNLCL